MSSKFLTDAELHEMIMTRQASLSRDEWQARINEAKEAFDRQEEADRAYTGNGTHTIPKVTTKRSYKVLVAENHRHGY